MALVSADLCLWYVQHVNFPVAPRAPRSVGHARWTPRRTCAMMIADRKGLAAVNHTCLCHIRGGRAAVGRCLWERRSHPAASAGEVGVGAAAGEAGEAGDPGVAAVDAEAAAGELGAALPKSAAICRLRCPRGRIPGSFQKSRLAILV